MCVAIAGLCVAYLPCVSVVDAIWFSKKHIDHHGDIHAHIHMFVCVCVRARVCVRVCVETFQTRLPLKEWS